jgi:hypothetical protein
MHLGRLVVRRGRWACWSLRAGVVYARFVGMCFGVGVSVMRMWYLGRTSRGRGDVRGVVLFEPMNVCIGSWKPCSLSQERWTVRVRVCVSSSRMNDKGNKCSINAVIDLDRASDLKWSARQTRTGPCPPFRIDVSPSSALPRSSLSPPKRAISLAPGFSTPYPHYPHRNYQKDRRFHLQLASLCRQVTLTMSSSPSLAATKRRTLRRVKRE